MKGKTATRRAMLLSLTSLLICAAMLVGTTFAWFTDSVSSGTNRIIAGNLDVELTHQTSGMAAATPVGNTTELFQTAYGDAMLWEPGAMAYETFTVSNVGTLALKYQLNLTELAYNNVRWGTAAETYDLTQVVRIAVLTGSTVSRSAIQSAATAKITDVLASNLYSAKTSSLEPGASETFTVVLYWAPNGNDVDNLYNLKNGAYHETSNPTGWTLNEQDPDGLDRLYIAAKVMLLATQYTSEFDSFDNQYDATANTFPAFADASLITTTAPVVANEDTKLTVGNLATATVKGSSTLTKEGGEEIDSSALTSLTLEVEE